jgi:hypothetical protein
MNQHSDKQVCGGCGRSYESYCAACADFDDHVQADPFAGVRKFEDPATVVRASTPIGCRRQVLRPLDMPARAGKCCVCRDPLPLVWWEETFASGRTLVYPTLAPTVAYWRGRSAHALCVARAEEAEVA